MDRKDVSREHSGMALGKPATEGESPVRDMQTAASGIRSTMRHVEPRGK